MAWIVGQEVCQVYMALIVTLWLISLFMVSRLIRAVGRQQRVILNLTRLVGVRKQDVKGGV